MLYKKLINSKITAIMKLISSLKAVILSLFTSFMIVEVVGQIDAHRENVIEYPNIKKAILF